MQTLTPKKPQQPKQHPEAPQKKSKLFLHSAVFAIALFLLVNVVMLAVLGPPRAYSNNIWNGTGSIDITLKDYRALAKKPDVALLGSSIVMYPFWAMDFNNDKQNTGDIFHHHRSFALEKVLNTGSDKKYDVFSLAIFGQMASDVYIFANELFKPNETPKVAVWGIAPRDFYDAELASPMNTITFQRMVGLQNLGPYAEQYLPSYQQKLDFILSKGIYLYGQRWYVQKEVRKGFNKLYSAMFGVTEAEYKPNQGFNVQHQGALPDPKFLWDLSVKEYKSRYRNIDTEKLTTQMRFSKKLIEMCKDKGVKLIVVNMPLSDSNRGIMPDGFYNAYIKEVKALAEAGGADFVDVGADPQFDRMDYWDTAHMNHSGGYKLIDKLAPAIKKYLP